MKFNIIDFDNLQETCNTHQTLNSHNIFIVKDINIFYDFDVDGGGKMYGQEFISLIQELYPNKKFSNLF